ncbi:MAG TPA: zinc ABC transporter ATP-binding protein AztA [Euzebyales bacterium]|nr:zinc ABC transporter ATP-binding protein AztA [Euzebyales bacterium]
MPELAVEGRDVTVVYGRLPALRHCDVAVPQGTVTALVGPNGSGKSTLLSAIAGLVPLTAGALTVLGRRPGHNGLAARVAYVLQSTPANESLPVTVREVVTMARFARRGLFSRLTAADRRAVDDALAQLQVADLADRHLRELSGGQRQRVLVAQGLAQGADLLLLDEPVTGLDLTSRERILAVVDDVRDGGGTVIVATHDLDDAERADHVMLLAGTVVAAGTPEQVITAAHLRRAYGGRPVADEPAGGFAHVDEHVHGHGAPVPRR